MKEFRGGQTVEDDLKEGDVGAMELKLEMLFITPVSSSLLAVPSYSQVVAADFPILR